MEDELLSSSSPSTAFCTESVAAFDTIWNPPRCQINLCAFAAVPQGRRDAMDWSQTRSW